MGKTYETEKTYNVWDNVNGVCIHVGPDREGVECVEISTRDPKSIEYYGEIRVVLQPDLAFEVAQAMMASASDILKKVNK